ncbi:MAG: acylneuraminate cytidylyltransferase [Ignavibacteria bacterium]|nr:acylneuraminate cytidylyltransferase [Ignavibacteria bacterium]
MPTSSNNIAIVQARYGSTRLPGKIFKEIVNKPMLWHVINRLSDSKLIDKIVIATTTNEEDDLTENFCIENDIEYYRGSSENVLERYFESAKKFNADIIIRITSDCPLIDPDIIDEMLNIFSNEGKVDYLSNVQERTFPRGLDTEIFSFQALEKAFLNSSKKFEQEHVTPFIYSHPELFTIKNHKCMQDYSFHRWTVDTEEDFQLIAKIYNHLYNPEKNFLLDDILKLFDKYPELIKINEGIKQKSLSE